MSSAACEAGSRAMCAVERTAWKPNGALDFPREEREISTCPGSGSAGARSGHTFWSSPLIVGGGVAIGGSSEGDRAGTEKLAGGGAAVTGVAAGVAREEAGATCADAGAGVASVRGVAKGFGAGVWSFSAGSALVSDFDEAAGFELPPPPDTSAGTLTARSVGRSIFESKRSRCPPAESGRYSDSRSSNFVLMRCSRQIWRTDNRV